ncbi:MAG TPA: hypothetical protein DCL61_22570, partial [Cyanobacteria bacterium UBA12227]|nr:hypothetical protein [Cyanobacteria bacterium UBA12227]
MPLSNLVRQRYTPPTCTLEIVAKASPLSRWVGQSVLKDLRFELRFDDPRQPTDKPVTISGDRIALEVLHEAVTSYVQDFLGSSSTHLPLTVSTATVAPDPTSEEEPRNGNISLSESFVKQSPVLVQEPSEESESSVESNSKVRLPSAVGFAQSLKPRTLPGAIYLEPRGLLAHNLFLGQLANEESGSLVKLSVLQLFDLATALDDYATSVVALPNLNRRRRTITPAPWAWAAAVMVLAVGVTSASVQWLRQSESTQQAATSTAEGESAGQTSELAQVPPAPTDTLPTPPAPLATPTVPRSLSPAPKLPPPGPVKTPPSGTSNSSQTSQRPDLSITPPPERRRAVQPGATGTTSRSGGVSPRKSGSSSQPENAQNQQSRGKVSQTPPPLPNLPSLNITPSPAEVFPDVASQPSVTQGGGTRSLPPSASVNPVEPAEGTQDANSRLFDTIPQIEEVRNKLQPQWQPPENLPSKLEYDILLDS